MITGAQIRAALAGINWSRSQLSEVSGVPFRTVQRICEVDGVPSSGADKVALIEAALKAQGVRFTDRGVEFT